MLTSPDCKELLNLFQRVHFEEAWERRETQVVDGVEMHFISKCDLIAAKKAAARPQDLIDVVALESE
jgi:hypothetical protein